MCRREGKKLFLKDERCYSAKCPLIRKKYPPGVHGPKGYSRLSEYGLQLREKQRMKRFYGLLEKQFKNYFVKSKKSKGNTEVAFLKFLEKRLDNVVYRAGFYNSRGQARQVISHGNILVNNRRLDIPSYQVRIGDVVQIKQKSRIAQPIAKRLSGEKEKIAALPSWLSLDRKNLQVKILGEPELNDLPKEFEMELIVAFYSR